MKIAILSNGNANYSTKRLVEEAEKRGHEVDVIKYKNCYISIESRKNKVFYKGKPLENYDAIIPRISNSMTKYGTAIVRQLEMQGEYVLSKSIAITRARDKLRSMQVLAKYGVDVPKTVVSRNTADIDGVLDELGEMPVIIKLAYGTHGNGVILADTRISADGANPFLHIFTFFLDYIFSNSSLPTPQRGHVQSEGSSSNGTLLLFAGS